MEDLLKRAVDYARQLGAEYAEARYQKDSLREITIVNSEVLSISSRVRAGVAVRVLVDGAMAFGATSDMNWDSIKDLVEKVFSEAKASSRLMKKPIKMAPEEAHKVSFKVDEKKPLENVPLEEKVKFFIDAYKNAAASVKEAKIASVFIVYSEHSTEKIFVNSEGSEIKSYVVRPAAYYIMTEYAANRGSVQRFYQFGASGGWEAVEQWNFDKELEEKARILEKILFEAKEPPTDRPVDVVVGSEIVGLIVHESCGHPSEADRILGREAAQAGESFIKPNMIGERIGSEAVTVIDDPTIPGSYGFYLYDDEGVKARPRELYKEGRINEFLHNRETAAELGVRSNAAARAMDYASEPIVRMANTYFKPGDYSFEELVEDIKYGVYMKSYMEWNIDDRRWNQRYVGLEAYLIENGELKHLVRNPVLEITTKGFYMSVDAADKNLQFSAGTCGKGEPMQGVPVWFGGPNVRLRGIRLGVAPK